jgi:hypothetical protein
LYADGSWGWGKADKQTPNTHTKDTEDLLEALRPPASMEVCGYAILTTLCHHYRRFNAMAVFEVTARWIVYRLLFA